MESCRRWPQGLSRAGLRDRGFADISGAHRHHRDRDAQHRQPPGLAQEDPRDRGPARDPLGIQLGAVPADAAGLVRLRLGGREPGSRNIRSRACRSCRSCTGTGRSSARCCRTWTWCWPRADRDRLALRRAGARRGAARKIFGRIRREWHASIETLLAITGHERLLQGNPLLERSIRNRFPYLDPLNHVQVELLKAHRAQNPDEQVLRGIQLTINGISAGLRNSG